MNNENYLVESIVRARRMAKQSKADAKAANNKQIELQRKYLLYKQRGGLLPITHFQDPEYLSYERDKKKNPKAYPNINVWRKKKMKARKEKAEIEEKETKNARRRAQAKHEESIAEKNRIKNAQMMGQM